MQTINDYAYPCMMAENALKRLHQSMLDKDYDSALAAGMEVLVQASKTIEAIEHEKRNSPPRQGRSGKQPT